jgi:hypothetical protein
MELTFMFSFQIRAGITILKLTITMRCFYSCDVKLALRIPKKSLYSSTILLLYVTRPFKQANGYKSLDLHEIGLQWLWISLKLILTQNPMDGDGHLLHTTGVATITVVILGPITAVHNNMVSLHRTSNLPSVSPSGNSSGHISVLQHDQFLLQRRGR